MRINMPAEHESNPIAHLAENYAAEIVNAGFAFSKAVYQHSSLSLREFEGARVRTAQINGCKVCQNFRAERDLPGYFENFGGGESGSVADSGPAPDEEFYRNVAQWRDYSGFSEREKLAIAFAEGMGTDPHGLAADEELWRSVRAAFSDAEIVDMTYAVASWMGLGRATHVLGMDSLCAWVPASE